MSRFKSRKLWLAVVAQLAGLAAVLFPEHSDTVANAVQQVGGLVVMALAAFGYIQGESKIDAERVKGEQQRAANRENIDAHREMERERYREESDRPEPQAQQARNLGMIALAVILPLAMIGCESTPGGYDADTPKGQYDIAQESFIAVVKTLNTGRQVGTFDDEEWAEINSVIQQADGILDAMEAAALADDSSVHSVYLDTFDNLLRKLRDWAVQVSIEESADESADRGDSGTVGPVRPGAFHAGDESQRQGAGPQVPGGAEEAEEAAGRAVGRAIRPGAEPRWIVRPGWTIGIDPAAGPDRSAIAFFGPNGVYTTTPAT